jgi:DNA-binding CsgD family transcriptional regulator
MQRFNSNNSIRKNLVSSGEKKASTSAVSRKNASRSPYELTSFEKEIMGYTVLGKTAWEISCIHGVSEEKIRKCLKKTYKILGVNNKVSAVIAYLCREMLIELIAAKSIAHSKMER